MTKPIIMDPHAPCPCHHGASYGVCCKPLHDGQAAPTAERLMRSRYAAYVLKLDSYLLATWHPSTRPSSIDLDTPKWLGLQVRHHHETIDCMRSAGSSGKTDAGITWTANSRDDSAIDLQAALRSGYSPGRGP